MPDEAILILKLKRGSRNAFKELYERNITPLYRFMSQFSHDKYLVEEWVQRAFIKSYEKIELFDGNSKFSTWLFKIAVNEMRMDFRQSSKIPVVDFEENDLPDIETDEIEFEWDQLMKQWLQELDEVKRLVFVLFEVEGYSHSEISTILNIKESTSRTILTRTKKWLQTKWNETECI